MKSSFFHLTRLLVLLGLPLGSRSSPAFVAYGSGRATEILAQMRAASGGDRWKDVHTLHTLSLTKNSGEEEQREHWEDVATGRYSLGILGANARKSGFDGLTSWIQGRSGIAYAFGDSESLLASADESFRVSRAWWFPERFPGTIAFDGAASDKGRRYDVLGITPAGGRPFEVWIDHETHLLARIVEQQGEGTLVTSYTDYRTVQGLNLPFTIRYGDGQDAESDIVEHVQSVEVDLSAPENTFSIPPRPQPDVEFPPNTDSVDVPFRIAENNRILVPINVDGLPIEAWFDSGGSLFLQPGTVAKLNAETHGRHQISGGGEGIGVAGIGKVGTITIGGAKVRGLSFHNFSFYPPDPSEALLGLEILQRFVVKFDFDRGIMKLTKPQAFYYRGKGAVIPFHFQSNQPEITGSIDGIAGRFAIDTGDTGSLLLIAPFARRFGLQERYQADIPYDGKSVGATKGVWARKRAHIIDFDGADGRPIAEVRDPVTRISLQNSGFDANRYVAANIGLGILRQFNVTFDYLRQRVILEPNHLYGQPDIYNRTGFRLTRGGTAWTIDTIFPFSPADEAGLKGGDVIEAINGKSAQDIDDLQLSALLRAPIGTQIKPTVRRANSSQQVAIALRDVF